MSIYTLINEIENGDLVLPAIQRDFVWHEKQIETLLDSVFRGYPVGIVLLWDTYQPIQIRDFAKNHIPQQLQDFKENDKRKRIRLVLDGQQRLSSLFVALRGSFNGQKLYFDLLSGKEADDHADVKYRFEFGLDSEIKAKNLAAIERRASPSGASATCSYWMLLSDIIGKNPRELLSSKNKISKEMALDEDERLILEINIQTASYALTDNSEILKTQTIDANLPPDDEKRKSAFDILEIFVRINSQGTTLKRSDLIISMLRLYWQDSSSLLPKFIQEINEGNSFEIGNDFVIRCMFATADIGTRLDFDLLRRQSNVEKIKSVYGGCFDAIRIAVDFVRSDCGIDSAKLLGGINTLVPLVYFLYKTRTKTFGVMSRANARKSLLLFAFSRVFSQHVDSRAGGFIRNYLELSEEAKEFPLASAIKYVKSYTGIEVADSYLFGLNIDLALAIIQSKSGGKVKHFSNQLEIDHIFPKSKLYEKDYDPANVNRIGNYWMLPLGVNRNKSAQHPAKFFSDIDQSALDAALIDKGKLDYRSFLSFTREREATMTAKLVEATGLSPELFKSALSES